jgi:outer membrane murein-binding lipoprotein Lpp
MKKLLRQISLLVEAIGELAKVKAHEFEWFRSHCEFATKQDLKITEHKIMSAISEFAARQDAFNNRIDVAVDGLTSDVQVLVAKIEELQNTAGQITPEDQALLDAIQSRSDAIAAKLEALDALTPPPVPAA